jgi:S1-C subfamily serine protease
MKRIAAFGIAVWLSAVPSFATDWSPLATKLTKSVVYIETNKGSCTGFVINAAAGKDGDQDYILTAAHCDGDKLYADGADAKVVYKDVKKDLMVLVVNNLDRPALTLAKDNPKPGEELMSFGYGYGFERPMLRITHVADDDTHIDQEGIGGPFIVTDATFVGGQSGGPVINVNGEVAMIVQRGSNAVGFGVGAEVMKSKVGRYFEKSKP